MSEELPGALSPEKRSGLKEAYALLGATTPLELSNLYSERDQELMKSGAWDYENPSLITNRVKTALESIDPTHLSEEEQKWSQEVLWFWYHHAISCAIVRHKDRAAAQTFSEKALTLQSSDHPNKITRLLYFLVRDDTPHAEEWVHGIEEEPEKTTARELLEHYKAGDFYR